MFLKKWPSKTKVTFENWKFPFFYSTVAQESFVRTNHQTIRVKIATYSEYNNHTLQFAVSDSPNVTLIWNVGKDLIEGLSYSRDGGNSRLQTFLSYGLEEGTVKCSEFLKRTLQSTDALGLDNGYPFCQSEWLPASNKWQDSLILCRKLEHTSHRLWCCIHSYGRFGLFIRSHPYGCFILEQNKASHILEISQFRRTANKVVVSFSTDKRIRLEEVTKPP